MDAFSVRDLRERTGDLTRAAEAGRLSLVSKHSEPLFVAVPFDDTLIENGVRVALAVKLYAEEVLSLSRAARVARLSTEAFIGQLGALGIPVVRVDPAGLEDEVALVERLFLDDEPVKPDLAAR